MKKFSVDINLDDEDEVNEFFRKYGMAMGDSLANSMGLPSEAGREELATAFHYYAWHKRTAISLRASGRICEAQGHEGECDRNYKENIVPVCKCW